MQSFLEMSHTELEKTLQAEQKRYSDFCALGLKLDMSRGKPAQAQLDLSQPMLTILKNSADCFSKDGTDCRNYGVLEGILEAKDLMAHLLDDNPENTIVLGNSSLTAMHDAIARCLKFGCLGSTPWEKLPAVKFICVVPGYDRHFTILENFGIEMINVEMRDDGPDMDVVEQLVKDDDAIKGIWCVPKYSNPSGTTYSDEVVRRLASMKCAACDFRIFWDNAYCVHHLYNDTAKQDKLLDIAKVCSEAGNPNRYIKFASTSKITFPGNGICALASSAENISEAKRLLGAQMIGGDKLSQLRHVKFLPDANKVMEHMNKQADIIRPKFELVEKRLAEELEGLEIARWTKPRGGYFVSFDGLANTAIRTINLAKDAGVVLTDAGATYPYGKDPNDSNIRIAPTMPSIESLSQALDVFCCCVKLAALESLI